MSDQARQLMASLADKKGARLVARPDVVSQRRPGQGRRSLLGPARYRLRAGAAGFRLAGAAGFGPARFRLARAGRFRLVCPPGFFCLRYTQIVTI